MCEEQGCFKQNSTRVGPPPGRGICKVRPTPYVYYPPVRQPRGKGTNLKPGSTKGVAATSRPRASLGRYVSWRQIICWQVQWQRNSTTRRPSARAPRVAPSQARHPVNLLLVRKRRCSLYCRGAPWAAHPKLALPPVWRSQPVSPPRTLHPSSPALKYSSAEQRVYVLCSQRPSWPSRAAWCSLRDRLCLRRHLQSQRRQMMHRPR